MRHASVREKLIGRVVGAAAEALTLEEIGRDALPAFEQLVGTGKALLYCSKENQPLIPIAGASECLPEYGAEFAPDDPLQHSLSRESPPIFAATRCREWENFRKREGLVEFYDRWDITWLMHLRLSEASHMQPGYVAVVCGRATKQEDFSTADLDAAAAVLPALSAAVRRAGRMAIRLNSAAAVEALFEREKSRAVLALDLDGRPLWMSSRAESLLQGYLGTRRRLPDPLLDMVRRFARLARGTDSEREPLPPFQITLTGEAGESLEGEAYLARTASGDPFVTVDFGGAQAPPNLCELARTRGLTRTETEILSDLIAGQADAEIAGKRFVSIATVRTHVSRVLSKLGVRSRLQAVAQALGTAAFKAICLFLLA